MDAVLHLTLEAGDAWGQCPMARGRGSDICLLWGPYVGWERWGGRGMAFNTQRRAGGGGCCSVLSVNPCSSVGCSTTKKRRAPCPAAAMKTEKDEALPNFSLGGKYAGEGAGESLGWCGAGCCLRGVTLGDTRNPTVGTELRSQTPPDHALLRGQGRGEGLGSRWLHRAPTPPPLPCRPHDSPGERRSPPSTGPAAPKAPSGPR